MDTVPTSPDDGGWISGTMSTPKEHDMAQQEYTVQVEAGNADSTIWQALAPSETATGESADEVARWTASNQSLTAGGNWRVRVWAGADADISGAPSATYQPTD